MPSISLWTSFVSLVLTVFGLFSVMVFFTVSSLMNISEKVNHISAKVDHMESEIDCIKKEIECIRKEQQKKFFFFWMYL